MNTVIRTLVLGAALLGAPHLLSLSALWVAVAAIALGVMVAWSLDGKLNALVLSAGAAASLALVLLLPTAPSLAGAVFLTIATLPRTLRASSDRGRAASSSLAFVGGAVGMIVVTHYGAETSFAVRAACLVVSGLVASLPTLAPADEHVAHEIDALASSLTGDVAATLSRAALLRRKFAGSEILEQLPGETRTRIEAGWTSLLHTAGRRASLGAELAAGAALIDTRIASHVDVLERIHSAAAERVARTLGLDDRGIDGASIEREGLEAEVRALAEITEARTA